MVASIADVTFGMTAERTVVFTEELVRQFSIFTEDDAPVHISNDHARSLGFDGRIAHGLLVGSMYSVLLGKSLPGPNSVILRLSLNMLKPVLIGQTIKFSVSVTSVSEAARSVTLDLAGRLPSLERVSSGSAVCVFRGRN